MTTRTFSTIWHSMRRIKWTWTTKRRTTSCLAFARSYRSAWCSTLEGHFQNLSAMSSSQMMRSTPTRRQRSGRLWQLSPVVLPRGIRQCTIMAPLTRLASINSSISTSFSSSSGLLAHLSASTSRQHLRLYPTSACAVPACTIDHWSRLWPHLLQLWSFGPLHSRVHCTEEEQSSGPHQSSVTWSAEGGCCKDRPHQLHHYGGHSRGRASPHGYVFSKHILLSFYLTPVLLMISLARHALRSVNW
jgi:hypothetical protein